ncbi:hypothetical protein NU688_28925 [Variovorax sp. ZS18.2.2]|uniref:hypothetical protein n=1 Tax=Variovorax sp. ZS18.2.2 TaxID=2971255 RepID=UPI002151C2F6|nr:hypothetical protein [Variovorax sp. ZS18.2.2]MCR6480212.1 hypothetical protein [Variovorax sp. ZS18.2.2]
MSGVVTVQGAAVLTIDPGVVVYMGAGAELRIESGKLLAQGEAARPIKFTSEKVRSGANPAAGDWGQLVLAAGATGSAIQHTEIAYGRGLSVSGAAVAFDNVRLFNHAAAAISADLTASLSGSGNQAAGNTLNAVVVPSGDVTGTTRFGLRGIPYLVRSGTLSVGASPTIDTVNPGSILAGETATLSITGKRLSGAVLPKWSLAGLTTQVLPDASDTKVQLKVEAALTATPGSADLTLLTDAGEAVGTNALIVQRNQPRITALNPSSFFTAAGAGSFTVTGTFFAKASVVELDGQALATTYNAETQLTAALPEQSVAGSRSVRLRTPDPLKAGAFLTSNVLPLNVVQAKAAFAPATASMFAGASQTIALQLPFNAPAGGLEFNLTSTAPAIATVQPSVVVVPAGSKTANFQVQGVDVGESQVVVARSAWANATLPVAVIQPPVTLAYEPVASALVGVMVGTETKPVLLQSVDGLASPLVGVAFGTYAKQLTPAAAVVGTSLTLKVEGEGLGAVSAMQFVPADGLTVGIPSVSADGKLLSVSVVIDAAATKSTRRVILSSATGRVPFTTATGDQFVVAAPAPRIDFVNPNVVTAGQSAVKLSMGGQNLRDIQSLRFEPPQGVVAIDAPVANADGTQIDITVQTDADAKSGPRTVVVTTAGGESSVAPTPGNTFQVAREIGANYRDLSSPMVGVQVGAISVPQEQAVGPVISAQVGVMVGQAPAASGQSVDPVTSPLVGLVVGSGAFEMTPAAGSVGTSVNVVVQGTGLSSVTAVEMLPANNLTVSKVVANTAGTQLSFTVAIDAAADKTVRRVVLKTSDPANPVVPFLLSAKSQFLVAAQLPVVDISVTPQVVVADGPRVDLIVRGRNLRDVLGVRFVPPQGITALGTPVANADGTSMLVSAQASADAKTGPRVLVVKTVAGESSEVSIPANTVQVARKVEGPFNDVSSALVGVMVGTPAVDPLVREAYAPAVGVVVGPVVTAINPPGLVKGTSGTLVVSGFALAGATAASLTPVAAEGRVTLGKPVVNTAGLEASVPFKVELGATSANHRFNLLDATGARIPTLTDASLQLRVLDAPSISSFEPIVMTRGRSYTLVVRGSNLKEVQRIAIEPAADITSQDLALAWSSDSLGEKLTLRVILSPTAATGPRIVRLVYPGGMTSGQSATSNTLSVEKP